MEEQVRAERAEKRRNRAVALRPRTLGPEDSRRLLAILGDPTPYQPPSPTAATPPASGE